MEKESTLLNVLLIEDSDTDAFLIQRALNRYHKGVTCHRVATLQAGEEVLQSGGVDLVLLDLGLPDTESPKGTYEKAKRWTEELPIIIMTNLQDHELAKSMVHEGVADFLNKDLIAKDPAHIQKVIDFAVERHAIGKKLLKESRDKDAVLDCFMGGYSVSNK
jgi:DNA-binding NtrC family response regulator